MHEDNSDIVNMAEVIQLGGEVDIPRDKYHSRGRRIGVGKATKALTKFVICCIFGNGIDVYKGHLEGGWVKD